MFFASTSIRSFTVLTEDDGVPGLEIRERARILYCGSVKKVVEVQRIETGRKTRGNFEARERLHYLVGVIVLSILVLTMENGSP